MKTRVHMDIQNNRTSSLVDPRWVRQQPSYVKGRLQEDASFPYLSLRIDPLSY